MVTVLKEVDAVVIGMGWTGSILSRELTKAGLNVVGLERGGMRSPREDFAIPHSRSGSTGARSGGDSSRGTPICGRKLAGRWISRSARIKGAFVCPPPITITGSPISSNGIWSARLIFSSVIGVPLASRALNWKRRPNCHMESCST